MVARALQQRILTALALVPAVVAAVLLLPTPALALVFALIALLAAWEWSALGGVSSGNGRLVYPMVVGLCMLTLWQPALRQWFPYLLIPAVLWWWALTPYLFRLKAIESKSDRDGVLFAVGLLVLIGPWVALVLLHARSPDGPLLVVFLLVLIWVADSAAYFVGRRWGRTKLAPVLSPGKTRAGVYGALLGAALCAPGLAWAWDLSLREAVAAVLICTLTAFVSVVGDLFESLLKRRRGMKDSGRLLPGHGGVLDRIDSLTAAAPTFTLGILWLEAGL